MSSARQIQYVIEWQQRNKERYNKYQREYAKTRGLQTRKRWFDNNIEKMREYHRTYNKQWRANNKEKQEEYQRKYRIKKREAKLTD
jgi:hypothetical protein